MNISLSCYFRTEIIEEQKELEREVAALGERLVEGAQRVTSQHLQQVGPDRR